MADIEWPVMWIGADDDLPQIGVPELEWQGKPLTIPTMGTWSLDMSGDTIATLTVQIAVIVRVRSKSENQ